MPESSAKVSACVMVKNMAATIGRTIASVRPYVDEVCVLDTGSTDGTLALLAELASAPGSPVVVQPAEWPGNYAHARTLSTSMASNAWVITLDADEELRGGEHLRGVVEQAQANDDVLVLLARNYGDASPLGIAGDHIDLPARLFDSRRGRWHGLIHEHWAPHDPQDWSTRTRHLYGRRPSHHALHIYHLTRNLDEERRTTTYVALMERAITDPKKYDTPRALLYAAQLRLEDPAAAAAAADAYLQGCWDAIEGRFNSPRLEALVMLRAVTPDPRERSRTMAAILEYARAYGKDGRGELKWWGLPCRGRVAIRTPGR